MNSHIKQSSGFLNRMSLAAIALLLMTNTAYAIKTDGFAEIDHDEFKSLLIGNTMKGKYRGSEYYDYYDPKGELVGTFDGAAYQARWILGKGNCIVLILQSEPRSCWMLLKDPTEETYYFGKKTKKGKHRSMHKIEILQGAQY